MGNMHTYTGKSFDPMKMEPKDIDIRDIAHALSLMIRGGGQIRYFYSVAQHSINCALEARALGYSKRIVLACLFHDASEAYIADIIRPIKPYLTNYLDIESMMMDCVWKHIGIDGLTDEEKTAVSRIDDKVLFNELVRMIPGNEEKKYETLKSVGNFEERDMREVEREFLSIMKECMNDIK